MPESANVQSVEAIRFFHASLIKFQEEARLCLSSLEMQLLKMIGWLERERPGFWKREIEKCYRDMAEARVMLHKCQMRRVGDFKPTCFEERKAMEKAKRDLEFAQKQIPVVKRWTVAAHQEANEYHGRASQLGRAVEREIPRLLALLAQSVERLEQYGNIQVPGLGMPGPANATASAAHPDATPQPPEASSDAESAHDSSSPQKPFDKDFP